jgi:hypothetical protein
MKCITSCSAPKAWECGEGMRTNLLFYLGVPSGCVVSNDTTIVMVKVKAKQAARVREMNA